MTSRLARPALLCLLAAAGCGEDPVTTPTPMADTVDIIAGGSVMGTFQGVLVVEWNRPSAKGFTRFSLLGKPDKALGIESFGVDATIVGMPMKTHYTDKVAQITAGMRLASGASLSSSVTSFNRLDITEIGAYEAQSDGSARIPLHGTVAGSVSSLDSPVMVTFLSMF